MKHSMCHGRCFKKRAHEAERSEGPRQNTLSKLGSSYTRQVSST